MTIPYLIKEGIACYGCGRVRCECEDEEEQELEQPEQKEEEVEEFPEFITEDGGEAGGE